VNVVLPVNVSGDTEEPKVAMAFTVKLPIVAVLGTVTCPVVLIVAPAVLLVKLHCT
jgi:hypothetical protein